MSDEELNVGDMIKLDWSFYQFFSGFKTSAIDIGNDFFLVSKITKKYIYFEAFSTKNGLLQNCKI